MSVAVCVLIMLVAPVGCAGACYKQVYEYQGTVTIEARLKYCQQLPGADEELLLLASSAIAVLEKNK